VRQETGFQLPVGKLGGKGAVGGGGMPLVRMTSAANHKKTRNTYFDAPFSQLFVDLKEPKTKLEAPS